MAVRQFQRTFELLRRAVQSARAVFAVGPEGVLAALKVDPTLDLEALAPEYATLLHIARRTVADSNFGPLEEHVIISNGSAIVSRAIDQDLDLVIVTNSHEPLGRVRFELKKASRSLLY